MSLVFVGSNYETFTPTQSGALATIMFNCCLAARAEDIEPFVIARRCEAEPFRWKNAILLDYPAVPASGPGWWMARAERKALGWTHTGQRTHSHHIVHEIAARQLQQFPLVVLNNPETAILLRQKFPQARIFHWFHNQLEAKPRVRQQLPQALDGVLAVSNFTACWLQEYYGFAPERMTMVPNATGAVHFSPAPEPPNNEKPIINFVGRTGREKAPDLLLRAALQLSETTRDFAIQIIGSNHWDRFELDDYQRELQQLASQLAERGIEVKWTGHVGRAALPDALRRADINVVPSRWDEPFGMVTLEGMACGLATVASRTGGTPEVCGDAALLFERDDFNQLAEHLKVLLSDADLRAEYARRGREQALLFNWSRTWKTLWNAVNKAS